MAFYIVLVILGIVYFIGLMIILYKERECRDCVDMDFFFFSFAMLLMMFLSFLIKIYS